jgi:hypothetical protein
VGDPSSNDEHRGGVFGGTGLDHKILHGKSHGALFIVSDLSFGKFFELVCFASYATSLG